MEFMDSTSTDILYKRPAICSFCRHLDALI